MASAYEKIVKDNLLKLYSQPTEDLESKLLAVRKNNQFFFEAFGQPCQLSPDGIMLGDSPQEGVVGILISLYAQNTTKDACLLEPLKAYKDFPNSMPYAGAFVSHTQQVLVPKVEQIKSNQQKIWSAMNGMDAGSIASGDYSFVIYPLPKIALCYIIYEADDDFPASVTCLFSNNANKFLPMDALADVGEYTSKRILELLSD
jgi:hypothetical protein